MAITAERLHKQSVVIKQICKLFPLRQVIVDGERKDGSTVQYDQICNARLPRGLDPHSVPSEELAASLGYMVQLLNLVAQNLASPVLHNSGFAGSCSRIWQRDSYWDARPSSRSNEYPLFIPRQNYCSTSGENSWSDRSSCNFGVASMESERKPRLESSGSISFNFSSASLHSVETHKDLQKGISLLKKSVACITAYYFNSLCLDVPSEASTFEAFAKLLAKLSSSKEVRSVFSVRMACSRKTFVRTFEILLPVFFMPLNCLIMEKMNASLKDGILWSIPLFLLPHHNQRMLSIGLEPCSLMPQRNDLAHGRGT
ncbi:uncharacterized protein LOC112003604 isoform X2 [Quercus suber]|uniref:uncharacterized protein LOC112003604 isoform X2 n=1 Tax=Quercus suber TaxID=58331 RepID=UPI0032DE5AF3